MRYIKMKPSLTEREAAKIQSTIASAVAFIHSLGIVHRDLKPENILVTAAGVLKIADFGLARSITGDMTSFCGTLNTRPPPRPPPPRQPYSKAVDIWSLGIIMFVTLGGYYPFRSMPRGRKEEEKRILAGNFHFHEPAWSSVTDHAKRLAQRALCLDPKTRISLEEFRSDPWILHFAQVPQSPLSSPDTISTTKEDLKALSDEIEVGLAKVRAEGKTPAALQAQAESQEMEEGPIPLDMSLSSEDGGEEKEEDAPQGEEEDLVPCDMSFSDPDPDHPPPPTTETHPMTYLQLFPHPALSPNQLSPTPIYEMLVIYMK